MFQQLHIKICVIIILHLRIAGSYRVYHLDGDAESQLLPKLRQVLQGYEILNYAEVRPRQNRHRFKPVGKSMFVKRFIPHGYKTGEYEYDSRLHTVYKPLYRYHVDNPKDFVKQEIAMQQRMPDTKNDLTGVMQKPPKNKDLLQQIKKYLHKIIKYKRKKKKNKKKFKTILQQLSFNDEIKLLRFFEKSGELNDPWAPGKIPNNFLADQKPVTVVEEKPKVTVPEYPFWNYWTYQKTIPQDNCPPNLVKIGNMCVSSIGHRKNARRSRRRKRKLRY